MCRAAFIGIDGGSETRWDRGAAVDEAVDWKWVLTITVEGHAATSANSLWLFLQNQFSSNTTKAAYLHQRSTLCLTKTGFAST